MPPATVFRLADNEVPPGGASHAPWTKDVA